MKMMLKNFILITGFLFTVQSAYAGLFGWATTVTAINTSGDSVMTRVTGPSYPKCELKRENVMSDYLNLGYSNIQGPDCVPISIFTKEIKLQYPKLIKWPGPICLSCPFLNLESIKNIYREDYINVQELVKKHNIDTYNQELIKLQKEFDLGQFEQEMFDLERSIQSK